jgi:hypothetical protein
MLALAVASSFPKSNKPAQIASALFVFLFNFFIPIGFLGANFLYCAEVAPTRLRVKMGGISTANHWLWNFVVNMVTPVCFPIPTILPSPSYEEFAALDAQHHTVPTPSQIPHTNASQVAIETIGWKYYLVFLVISAIIVPVVYFTYPETMGRSLEEIETMFSEGTSIAGIVKESKKPLVGGGLGLRPLEKEKKVDEEEYA